MNYAIVLAACLSKRMHQDTSNAAIKLLYKPMINYVIDALKMVDELEIIPVLGYKKEDVIKLIGNLSYVIQDMQLGTADAIKCALPKITNDGYSIIIPADVPLIDASDLQGLLELVKTENLDLGFLSAILPDGYGYKRVIKDSFNFVKGIVDEDNASQEEKAIKEVLSDVFVIRNDVLKKYISFIKENNNEYDFLDIIKILSNEGLKIKSYIVSNPVDITSCNDNLKLSMLEQYLQRKINVNLLKKGIYIENPFMQTIVSIDSFIEPGVKIYNNCKIINSVIKAGATIKDNSIIINSQVGASIISNSVIEDSIIGDNVTIGPYAHIRLNSNIGNNCRIGNYVEIKNSLLGDSTKCAHLTYIGDANVGSNCNFGCGTVTVNYDGINKNKTIIGNNVFIGCNANLIAPIEIKDNAFIAAGSTITDNLDIDDFAIARARQVTKKGYSKKYKR